MKPLTGSRFLVTYRLAGPEARARATAADLCIEQTIEFPRDLVHDRDIRRHIFGRVEDFRSAGRSACEATLSFAIETVTSSASPGGGILAQLVNVIFGNASLLPGVRVERFDLPRLLLDRFRGPRLGRAGLRSLLAAPDRPLLCSALKPMGLSPQDLADMAYRMALGGIDLIKDDHGLADQPFCPFEERVARCAQAVLRANRETGGKTLYCSNVTAAPGEMLRRAHRSRELGAGGFLVAPGLTGLDAMLALSESVSPPPPILSHPAFQGSFVVGRNHGMSHFALFGQLNRLAGADAVIFPHFGGRFAFTRRECRHLVEGTATGMGDLAPIFPVPAGGMRLDRVKELVDFYGNDVVLLIGGDLHRDPDGLTAACRKFRESIIRAPRTG